MSSTVPGGKMRVTTDEHRLCGVWVAHAYLHVGWSKQILEKLPHAGCSSDRYVARAEALRAGRAAALDWEQLSADAALYGFHSS